MLAIGFDKEQDMEIPYFLAVLQMLDTICTVVMKGIVVIMSKACLLRET